MCILRCKYGMAAIVYQAMRHLVMGGSFLALGSPRKINKLPQNLYILKEKWTSFHYMHVDLYKNAHWKYARRPKK